MGEFHRACITVTCLISEALCTVLTFIACIDVHKKLHHSGVTLSVAFKHSGLEMGVNKIVKNVNVLLFYF